MQEPGSKDIVDKETTAGRAIQGKDDSVLEELGPSIDPVESSFLTTLTYIKWRQERCLYPS